jgi:hypothetical protein
LQLVRALDHRTSLFRHLSVQFGAFKALKCLFNINSLICPGNTVVGSVNAHPARTLSAKSWTWDKPMKTNMGGHTTMKTNGLAWNKPMKTKMGGHTTMKNNGMTWSNSLHTVNGMKGNKNNGWSWDKPAHTNGGFHGTKGGKHFTWNKPSWKKNGATHA